MSDNAKQTQCEVIPSSVERLNPAEAYLLTLGKSSRKLMKSRLDIIANMLSAGKTLNTFDWRRLNSQVAHLIINKLTECGLKNSTINSYLNAMRGVIKKGFEVKVISNENFNRFKLIKNLSGNVVANSNVLTEDNVNIVIDYFGGKFANISKLTYGGYIRLHRDYVMIMMMLNCGLRRAEIANMVVGDIDINRREVRVLGKGRSERVVPLPTSLVTDYYFREWLVILGDDPNVPVFSSTFKSGILKDEKLTTTTIRLIVSNRCSDAGLGHVTAHDLRRTFATLMHRKGVSIKVLQRILGHRSITTTEAYIKADRKDLHVASDNLNLKNLKKQ